MWAKGVSCVVLGGRGEGGLMRGPGGVGRVSRVVLAKVGSHDWS